MPRGGLAKDMTTHLGGRDREDGDGEIEGWSSASSRDRGRVLIHAWARARVVRSLFAKHALPPSPTLFLRLLVAGEEASVMSILASIVKPLAYVSLPIFALKTFADTSPIARYYVRIGLYLSTIGVCSLWGVICSIGMGLTGRRLDVLYIVARSFYYLASRVVGIRLIVEGEEYLETRPSVLVGNHQSMLDILYLGRCVTCYAS